jgi:hypothetical protein
MVGDALCVAFPIENSLNLSRGNGRRNLLSSLLLLPWLREVNIGSGGGNMLAIVKRGEKLLVMRTFTTALSLSFSFASYGTLTTHSSTSSGRFLTIVTMC